MKIYRDGKEFVLTESELFNAYLEQEYLFDREDCLYELNAVVPESELNAISDAEIDKILDSAAEKLRKNIDKYEMDFPYAREIAVQDTLKEYKL